MERVPFSGSAVLKGVRTCADPRKLRLGQSHIVCMALDSGCTASRLLRRGVNSLPSTQCLEHNLPKFAGQGIGR